MKDVRTQHRQAAAHGVRPGGAAVVGPGYVGLSMAVAEGGCRVVRINLDPGGAKGRTSGDRRMLDVPVGACPR